jgi:catechol 2,3-dioxygenase-like lactoylglutathione lyase family enzyme
MKLGAFSISITVKDIEVSKQFYQKLGFEVTGGNQSQNWLILKNEETVIGLFQGMFEQNLMTFNPGWNQNAQPIDDFTDVREIQKLLKEKGVAFEQEANENTNGPAHFIITDPDGNTILVDQHR